MGGGPSWMGERFGIVLLVRERSGTTAKAGGSSAIGSGRYFSAKRTLRRVPSGGRLFLRLRAMMWVMMSEKLGGLLKIEKL